MSNGLALRFLNVAHFLDHFFLLVFPTAVLAIHVEWGMSYAETLSLATPAFVLFALATYPCGWLGDRWGGVPMMRLFFLGLGAASVATGFAEGPFSLSLGLAAIGLFTAIYHPVATAMVVQLAERPGRELGINGVWGNLGVALAAAITAGLTAWAGWRMAFLVPGLVTLALGAAYVLFSRRPVATAAGGRAAERKSFSMDPRDQRRVFFVVAVSALLGGLVFNGVTIALPKLFEERLDVEALGLVGVGAVTTGVFLAASFTQLFTGSLIDRLGPRPLLLAGLGLQAPLLLLLGLLGGAAVVPPAVPLMLVVFGVIPVSSWLLGHYVAPAFRSRAYGLQFLLALGVNAFVVPLISGMHAGTGGSAALFLLMAGLAALQFMAALVLPGRRPAPLAPAAA
ncbi:MFS transporter [Marinimicrococcus flavescens]|uniref:MFS transporter n=1 Tax=Marinimicrococcus flavescens TaxID=3031815 RepID=A0AAP4D5V0_9PROT|nr:MFS transporter [Marinimicrococcus flavescens]